MLPGVDPRAAASWGKEIGVVVEPVSAGFAIGFERAIDHVDGSGPCHLLFFSAGSSTST